MEERKAFLSLPISPEIGIGIILALFPFGWEMLDLPHSKVVGILCWSTCLVILLDIINKKWNFVDRRYLSGQTLVPSGELVLALFCIGFVIWNTLPRSKQSEQVSPRPISSEPAKTEPKKEEDTIKPVKNPLALLSFNSSQDILVSNNGPLSVYVMDILMSVKYPVASKSIRLGINIEPKGISSTQPLVGDIQKVRTLRGLAPTWKEHYDKAETVLVKRDPLQVRIETAERVRELVQLAFFP